MLLPPNASIGASISDDDDPAATLAHSSSILSRNERTATAQRDRTAVMSMPGKSPGGHGVAFPAARPDEA
jgi:hypothetical protein